MRDFSPIGNFNGYSVYGEFIAKRVFIPKQERQPDGTIKTKQIPVRRLRKNLLLVHPAGESVEFSSYVHQGQLRFKDSREKTSAPTDTHVVKEIGRMLLVDADKARTWLQLA